MAKLKKSTQPHISLSFTAQNYYLFLAGILVILAGYYFLGQGPANSFSSLSIAPVLLVVGYCILIPLAILFRRDKTESTDSA